MLVPYWRLIFDPKDIDKWHKIQEQYPMDLDYKFKDLNYLFVKYCRTKSESYLRDRFSLAQKYRIVEKTMEELYEELAEEKQRKNKERQEQWNEQQLKEESEDTRLQREEDLFERDSSLKFSKRSIPLPNPWKKNYDYGEIPNYIDRIEWHNDKQEKEK
jgi:hypothetical protein